MGQLQECRQEGNKTKLTLCQNPSYNSFPGVCVVVWKRGQMQTFPLPPLLGSLMASTEVPGPVGATAAALPSDPGPSIQVSYPEHPPHHSIPCAKASSGFPVLMGEKPDSYAQHLMPHNVTNSTS